MIARGVMGRGEREMQIVKTGKTKSGSIGLASKKLPCQIEISLNNGGKANLELLGYIQESSEYVQHKVMLSPLEIFSLINDLAHPKNQEIADAISKTLSDNVRDLTRLTAMAAGTFPKI